VKKAKNINRTHGSLRSKHFRGVEKLRKTSKIRGIPRSVSLLFDAIETLATQARPHTVNCQFHFTALMFMPHFYLSCLKLLKKIYSIILAGTFCGNASVDTDFIRVDVVTSSGETRSDVHMQVFPKKEVLDRQPKPGGIPLDVALIMFDSTSAANFERKMPNSLEYLTKELDSTLLRGELQYFILHNLDQLS